MRTKALVTVGGVVLVSTLVRPRASKSMQFVQDVEAPQLESAPT
jgi:hypothetical protein